MGLPKAFVDLAGQSMLHHCVQGVLSGGVVDRVVISVPADLVDQVRSEFPEVHCGGRWFQVVRIR